MITIIGGIGTCLVVTLVFPSCKNEDAEREIKFFLSEFINYKFNKELIESHEVIKHGDNNYLLKLNDFCSKYPELKFKDLILDESSINLARDLIESDVRKLLIEVSMNKKVKYEDLAKTTSEKILKKCSENGMLKSEIMVQCKANSSNLAVINSESEFNSIKGKLRCAHCNREYKDENISKIVSLSTEAKNMVSKSNWMNYMVVDELLKIGVLRELIKIGPEGNGEELDLLLAYGNKIIFFEFKDRDFGLGDAYPFHFRLRRYSADFGVIITTSKIADDAKKYLKEIGESGDNVKISAIEGMEDVSNKLKRLIINLNHRMATGIISQRLSNTGISEIIGIKKWMEKFSKIN